MRQPTKSRAVRRATMNRAAKRRAARRTVKQLGKRLIVHCSCNERDEYFVEYCLCNEHGGNQHSKKYSTPRCPSKREIKAIKTIINAGPCHSTVYLITGHGASATYNVTTHRVAPKVQSQIKRQTNTGYVCPVCMAKMRIYLQSKEYAAMILAEMQHYEARRAAAMDLFKL